MEPRPWVLHVSGSEEPHGQSFDGNKQVRRRHGVGEQVASEPSPRAGSSINGLLPRVKAHLGNTLWAPTRVWCHGRGHRSRAGALKPRHADRPYHQRRGKRRGARVAATEISRPLAHFIPLAPCTGLVSEESSSLQLYCRR